MKNETKIMELLEGLIGLSELQVSINRWDLIWKIAIIVWLIAISIGLIIK